MDNVQIQQVEQTVRFQHPEKLLTTVPPLDEPVIASILGLDVATYRQTKHQLEEQVRAAAGELLTDPAVADSIDRLPFRPGTTVVGVGDSNTDDLLSWLEMLRCLLELRRPQDRIRVLNAAVAAQTTSMALTRLSGVVRLRPAWIICALGSADALRVGPQPAKTLVSPAETARNVAEMRHMALLQTQAHWVWMTPPTVDERITAKYPPFQQAQLMLQNKDIMAVGDILRSQPEPVVDVQAMFGYPAAQEFVGPNGPTPSLTGQQAIAKALVELLAS